MSDSGLEPTLSEALSSLMMTIRQADEFAHQFLQETTHADYVQTSQRSLNAWLQAIHQQSRFTELENDPLVVRYIVDEDPCFSAYVYARDLNEIETHVSLGTLWSIQDLALRALSSENFFNAQSFDDEYLLRWAGSECRAPLDTIVPRQRYWNYAASDYAPDPKLLELWSHVGITPPSAEAGPWIGRFVKKLPFDGDRLQLAPHIIQIALTWTVIHEEAHWRAGHLPFLRRERRQGNRSPVSEEMSQAFEFQADKDATQGVADMFFKRASQNAIMPDYARGDWCWLLRFLMTSIGIAIVAMDIGRRHDGQSSSHPLPRIRFLTMARHLIVFAQRRHKARREIDGELPIDPRYGGNDLEGRFYREMVAQRGALWDLTDLQQMIDAEEDRLSAVDPGWPLTDAFPVIASPTLYWGATNRRDDVDFWKKQREETDRLARGVAEDFGMSVDDCLGYAQIAEAWVDDANELVARSNEHYREITREFRHWEVPDPD